MKKRGIATVVAIAIITVLFLIIFGISFLRRGVGKQMEYTDAHVRALAIAESGYQMLLARMMSKPWELRWFIKTGDSQANVTFERGNYSYFIEDTPGQTYSADIWVRGEYNNTKRFLFYRAHYEDQTLRGFKNFTQDYTVSMDESATSGKVNPFTEYVNKLVEKRKGNLIKSKEDWAAKFPDILSTLGALVEIPKPPGASSDIEGNLVPVDPDLQEKILQVLSSIKSLSFGYVGQFSNAETYGVYGEIQAWVVSNLGTTNLFVSQGNLLKGLMRMRKLFGAIREILHYLESYYRNDYSGYNYGTTNYPSETTNTSQTTASSSSSTNTATASQTASNNYPVETVSGPYSYTSSYYYEMQNFIRKKMRSVEVD
ncbi:MAG: hypothetical protein HQM09_18100 [Candidatus Riflebacteria bacterium]|nr:hypothetical protein [Candidatus Riflebacteria bacterium]